jgi:hypothetical protein
VREVCWTPRSDVALAMACGDCVASFNEESNAVSGVGESQTCQLGAQNSCLADLPSSQPPCEKIWEPLMAADRLL